MFYIFSRDEIFNSGEPNDLNAKEDTAVRCPLLDLQLNACLSTYNMWLCTTAFSACARTSSRKPHSSPPGQVERHLAALPWAKGRCWEWAPWYTHTQSASGHHENTKDCNWVWSEAFIQIHIQQNPAER